LGGANFETLAENGGDPRHVRPDLGTVIVECRCTRVSRRDDQCERASRYKNREVILTMAVFLMMSAMTNHVLGQDREKEPPLVMRVAVFSADQDRPDKYQPFVGDLFRTLQGVPGYVGTFLGRDAHTGQMISVSLWRNEADAVAGEAAVGERIRVLPPGSAPRPSNVTKYVVEFRDVVKGELSK